MTLAGAVIGSVLSLPAGDTTITQSGLFTGGATRGTLWPPVRVKRGTPRLQLVIRVSDPLDNSRVVLRTVRFRG